MSTFWKPKIRTSHQGFELCWKSQGKVVTETWKKVMLILQGSAVMGNYTLLFGKENITVGCDLVIFLIREGFVGGFEGREKIFCFRNANRTVLYVHWIHLVCWGQNILKTRMLM